jgi:hypothetical protein
VEIVLNILEGVAAIAVASTLVWLWHRGKKYLDNQKLSERRIDALQEALLTNKSVTDSLRKLIEAMHDEMTAGLTSVEENAVVLAKRLDDIMHTIHLNQENAADVDSALTREVVALSKQISEILQTTTDLSARVDSARVVAQTPAGVMSVAQHIKQSTPQSTDEPMEQQLRENGGREPSA